MTGRRVVLVDQYFPPDTSATARIVEDFAAACTRQGAPLTVICGYPSYDPPTRPPWLPLRRYRREGLTRYVIGSTGFDRRSTAGRVCNYLTFMIGAAFVLPFVTRRAAVVVMTDPPMAPLLAWWAKGVGRVASVTVWIQDLHPGFMVATGLLRDGLLARVWTAALRASLRAADDVVVLGRDMQARVRAVVDVPTRVVHNGWSGVAAVAAPHPTAPDARLRVMHFGNLGYAGPFVTVLEAARQLDGVADFVFVGGGATEGAFADLPPNVTVVDRVPHARVPELAADADLLLVGVQEGVAGFVVPSKGYEMMALGRALLVVAEPVCEIRRLVEEHACGVAVDDDASALAAALRAADRAILADMGARAAAVAPQYERAAQFATLVSLLSSC